ncbi:MAG: hypothetical protein KKE11_02670, partial [Gammaproteobacteria bacterium]|nr:hypothetical protein [Gammaproteobacteria bacterium]
FRKINFYQPSTHMTTIIASSPDPNHYFLILSNPTLKIKIKEQCKGVKLLLKTLNFRTTKQLINDLERKKEAVS